MDLLVKCAECPSGITVAFGLDHDDFARALWRSRWLLSVVTPRGRADAEPALAPLCGTCARRTYSPESLLEAARRLDAL